MPNTRYPALLLFLLLLFTGFGIPEPSLRKMRKEVSTFFEKEALTFELVPISGKGISKIPLESEDNVVYRISDPRNQLGWVCVGQASGKMAKFDYMVIFDPALKIVHTKVLTYREEHGGEIGSKRWLRQFNGKQAGERVGLDGDIDGISGATISVRSMTRAMDVWLETMDILDKKDKL